MYYKFLHQEQPILLFHHDLKNMLCFHVCHKPQLRLFHQKLLASLHLLLLCYPLHIQPEYSYRKVSLYEFRVHQMEMNHPNSCLPHQVSFQLHNLMLLQDQDNFHHHFLPMPSQKYILILEQHRPYQHRYLSHK